MKEAQRALQIQRTREAADLANHIERIQWLGQPKPMWSCGTPVDAHTRNVMMLQSRTAIAAAEVSP